MSTSEKTVETPHGELYYNVFVCDNCGAETLGSKDWIPSLGVYLSGSNEHHDYCNRWCAKEDTLKVIDRLIENRQRVNTAIAAMDTK